jgi:undecaprenyl diphosphate synthase
MSNGNGDHRLSPEPSALHVAIIMDGSGRWATARGLARSAGHHAGHAAVRRVVEAAPECGIRVLTLFTFSSDNWRRPAGEVAELLRIFEAFFTMDAPAFLRRGIRVSVVGRRDRLPVSLRDAIEKVEAASRLGLPLHVRLAIDYSGREAIVRAANQLRQSGNASAEVFAHLLAEAEPAAEPVPDIDLLIRTGGEQRLSDCPLWEIAYAELLFTPCLWPDFGAAELQAAVREFWTRDRRFGRIPTAVS